MPRIATDPATGQQYQLKAGEWVPIGGGGGQAEQAAPPSSAVREQAEADRKLYAPDTGLPVIGPALIGAGDVFNTVGMNFRDALASFKGDRKGQAAIAQERQDAERAREMLHESSPFMSRVGAALPAIAASVPTGGMSGFLGTLAQLGTGAAISGATSESGDVLRDAVMGAGFGAAGMAGQQIVGRVLAGRAAIAAQRAGAAGESVLSDAEREIIKGAERSGMAVTPAQRNGSLGARQAEAQIAAIPGADQVFAQIKQANERRLDSLAARAIGVQADNVGPEVQALAEANLHRTFRTIGEQIGTWDGTPFRKHLEAMAAEDSVKGFPNGAADRLLGVYNKGLKGREAAAEGSGDVITGEGLMDMRSDISGMMREAFQAGKDKRGMVYGDALEKLDEIIHKAAIRTGGPDLGDAYGTAREQWNVLRGLQRGGASTDGHVMPAALKARIESGDKTGMTGRATVDAKAGTTPAGESLSTQNRGTGIDGQNPMGDFYDALRFRTSRIANDALPMTGRVMGMANALNAAGAGLPGPLGTAATLAKRFGSMPLVRMYAGLSPEAAMVAGGAMAAMKNPGLQPGVVDSLRTGAAGAFGGGM